VSHVLRLQPAGALDPIWRDHVVGRGNAGRERLRDDDVWDDRDPRPRPGREGERRVGLCFDLAPSAEISHREGRRGPDQLAGPVHGPGDPILPEGLNAVALQGLPPPGEPGNAGRVPPDDVRW